MGERTLMLDAGGRSQGTKEVSKDYQLRIMGRDLYFPLSEILKDQLHASKTECRVQTEKAVLAEIQNKELRSAVQALEVGLKKAIEERDLAISENYQLTSRGQAASTGPVKGSEDLALLLATSKMQIAQLKSEIENLKDELQHTNEMLKMRDREIENLNRENEKLRKQTQTVATKPGQATSRTITPNKDAPSLRAVPGLERTGIKPFPGLFGLGKSTAGPKPVKAVALGERRVAGSVNSSYAEPPASKRSLNSSAISDSKSSVKFE